MIDPPGEQVTDLLAFNRHDVGEVISSGRTLEYDGDTGMLRVDPPRSKAGDRIVFEADGSGHRPHRLLGAAIE